MKNSFWQKRNLAKAPFNHLKSKEKKTGSQLEQPPHTSGIKTRKPIITVGTTAPHIGIKTLAACMPH
ncbi:hypothetical protein, partial [Suttonella indologenes]|uniref:hypothetical protein n=1 Tax=Suttonella indologenes TaxID=13276 RepID=UPI001C49AAD3